MTAWLAQKVVNIRSFLGILRWVQSLVRFSMRMNIRILYLVPHVPCATEAWVIWCRLRTSCSISFPVHLRSWITRCVHTNGLQNLLKLQALFAWWFWIENSSTSSTMRLIFTRVDAWLIGPAVWTAFQVVIFGHRALGESLGIGAFHYQLYLRLKGRSDQLPWLRWFEVLIVLSLSWTLLMNANSALSFFLFVKASHSLQLNWSAILRCCGI